jgi:predicted transcriptional regulator
MMRKQQLKEILRFDAWQTAGLKRAMALLDRGEGVSHERVKAWIES